MHSFARHTGCVFCRPTIDERARLCDTVITSDDNFVAIPTLGSIVPGWILVVSKDHVICSGALDPSLRENLSKAIDTAANLISAHFSEATIFEHGPAVRGTPVGCGIDHLHIHVAALPASLSGMCRELYGTLWRKIDNLDALEAIHRSGRAYILVKEPSGDWLWADAPVGVRQPLRRAVAQMLDIPDQFDYRTDAFEENVSLTLRELVSAA